MAMTGGISMASSTVTSSAPSCSRGVIVVKPPSFRPYFFGHGVGTPKYAGVRLSYPERATCSKHGGGALGAHMNLFDRFARVVKSYANALVSSFEDPEKILEQTVIEMNDDLIKMRQATAQVSISSPNLTPPRIIHFKSNQGTNPTQTLHETRKNLETSAPTMSEIMDSSRAQNLDLQLQTFGPFFRITARSLETQIELGRAEGVIRFWFGGKILHLDSIRLKRETLGMDKSIFGIGLFVGAVAIRHGYENGCNRAELLAINDTHLYHSKLVRFYTRIGFNVVYEVTGSSVGDLSHMLVWGGVGTRMDANIEELMIKWCSRFKTKTPIELPIVS